MTIKPLTCPRCGSPDLEEVTWNRRRCRHCGTESMLSSDRTRLQLVEWVCPSCGFNNESGTAFCGQCGAKLTKTCPKCRKNIRIDLQFCNFCGANYAEKAIVAERIRQRTAEGIARLEESRKAQKTRLTMKAILLSACVWPVCSCLLYSPALCMPQDPSADLSRKLCLSWALIGAIPLAIWWVRRKRSEWLERVDQEFVSKRQAVEESLAQELYD